MNWLFNQPPFVHRRFGRARDSSAVLGGGIHDGVPTEFQRHSKFCGALLVGAGTQSTNLARAIRKQEASTAFDSGLRVIGRDFGILQ
jgi:hypothetical protein